MMSPPSPATAGRTRVSISSLIASTVSASLASKNSPVEAASAPPDAIRGSPERKNSVTTPSTAGRRCCHSPSVLVTEMKSLAKNTPETPGSSISALASGERSASAGSRASNVPSSITTRPGRNLSVAGLGVASVWMNMGGQLLGPVDRPCRAAEQGRDHLRLRGAKHRAVRLEVEEGRPVDAVESPHMQRRPLAGNQHHDGLADRVRPDRRPDGEGRLRPTVSARALADEIAAGLMEPVEDLDPLKGLDSIERRVPWRADLDPADGAVGSAVMRAVRPRRPGRPDDADEEEARVDPIRPLDRDFVRPDVVFRRH